MTADGKLVEHSDVQVQTVLVPSRRPDDVEPGEALPQAELRKQASLSVVEPEHGPRLAGALAADRKSEQPHS